MPKKPQLHKHLATRSGPGAQRGTTLTGIKELLAKQPTLRALSTARAEQTAWLGWFRSRLPEELMPHITQVLSKPGVLTVCAESAGWCARLRYALPALEPEIRQQDPRIQRIEVRVAPAQS